MKGGHITRNQRMCLCLKSAVNSEQEQVNEMYKCTLIYAFSSNVCVH